MDDKPTQRDDHGRFAKGNSGGPGRPRGRRDTLRRAAEEAVTPEHIAALIRRQLRSGLEGNLAATKFVVAQTCGKPIEAPPETVPVDIQLPEPKTAADCGAAIGRVTQAIVDGTCDRATAQVLIDGIMGRLRVIEVVELEERLEQLEKAAAVVETRDR